MSELMGVRDAARELGVSHSTISRYLGRYGELNHGAPGHPLVNLEELRGHRDENITVRMEAERVAAAEPDQGEPRSLDSDAPPPLPRTKARHAALLLRAAERDEELANGSLVPRTEVEAGAYEAGRVLQEKLAARNRLLAERFATMNDPAVIAALMDESDRELLEGFSSAMEKLSIPGDPHADPA
jgi:hypothetical protein